MKPKVHTIENGTTLIYVPKPNNPTVTTLIVASVGASHEDKDHSGISHFIEHLAFKGTENMARKDITLFLEGLGAENNAMTSYEYTAYYVKSRNKDWQKIFPILADMYLNPALPEEEIKKERGVVLGEIDMYEDDPAYLALREVRSLLYPNSSYGRSVIGLKSNIKNITRDDILKYRQEHYSGKNTHVIIAGDIDFKEAKKLVSEKFHDLKKGKNSKVLHQTTKENKPKIKFFYKNTDQIHCSIAYKTPPAAHKDIPTLKMIAAILGHGMSSRLFETIREELGAGYYVHSSVCTHLKTSEFIIQFGTNKKQLPDVLSAIFKELELVKEEPVEKSELNKTLQYIAGISELNLETTDQVAIYHALQYIQNKEIKTLNQKIKELKSVTSKDIQRIASKYLTNSNLNVAIVGPIRKNQAIEDIIKNK